MKTFRTPPEFHNHPDSFDSASTPEAFAVREVELETGALTATDHGTMGACRRVYDIAHSKKYKGKLVPILGIEGFLRDDNCPILLQNGIERTYDKADGKPAGEPHFREYRKYYHFTLHYQDEAAFQAGSRILSRVDVRAEKHGSERKPIFNWADLEELGAYNVTLGSGCLVGGVQAHIMQYGRYDIAEQYYQKMRSLVKPGNFYAEVFPHICDKYWKSSVVVTFEDGSTENFRETKKIKTDKAGPKKNKDGSWHAEDLAEAWQINPEGHGAIREVMEDRKWAPREVYKKIANIQTIHGFIQNECHPWSPSGDAQLGCNLAVAAMAEKYGDKIIISGDSHFVHAEEKVVQDIRLSQNGSWRFANVYKRMTGDESAAYFQNTMKVPDARIEQWIDNGFEWGARFKDFKFSKRQTLPVSFYPKDTLRHIGKLILEHGRMENTPERWDRLNAELDLLHRNGTIDLLPYFMVIEEVCRYYATMGKLTSPGRGSAAGIMIAWLLDITHVDPLKYGLSKERFLTEDRIRSGKWPDIDQDVGDRSLLDKPGGWLDKRFGDCWAPISTDTKLKLRSSVKDVARWMRSTDTQKGYVPPDIEALTKKFMEAPQGIDDKKFIFGYDKDGEWISGSIESDTALIEYTQKYPEEWKKVQLCLGIKRSLGRHPCGIIIADTPVQDFIPLTSVGGVKVTQYTAASVEAAGGLKMDFLTVNVLNDIENCIKLVQQRHNHSEADFESAYPKDETPLDTAPFLRINNSKVPLIRVVPHKGDFVDIWDLPEDQDVFNDFCEGKTETVFQFSTQAAKKWLPHFNFVKSTKDGVTHKGLDSIESLAAFTALNRPGPLDAYVGEEDNKHNMLVEYARRAKGLESIGSFPILDSLFKETYGICVFQEQIQKAFQTVGKTTGIEADRFRVHVGKKMPMEMIEDKKIFMGGAVDAIGEEQATQLWKTMEVFGGYAFNKSHAVSYVTISYACAWLKHHYPLEWWMSVLKNASKKEVEDEFWPHCQSIMLPPDIGKSGQHFQIDGDKIRTPLSVIAGIGERAQLELEKGRPYTDLESFVKAIKTTKETEGRSSLHRGILTKLICSGVLDSMFTAGAELPQQLEEFEAVYAKVFNKKSPAPPDTKYTCLPYLSQYQLKKSILLGFGKDLRPMFMEVSDSIYKDNMGEFRTTIKGESYTLRDAATTAELLRMSPLPQQGIRLAVAAYVVKDTRRAYHNNTKRMAELTIELEGSKYDLIKWPDKKGLLPVDFLKNNYTGCLVLAVIKKYKEDRPATLEEIVVIQPQLTLKEEEASK